MKTIKQINLHFLTSPSDPWRTPNLLSAVLLLIVCITFWWIGTGTAGAQEIPADITADEVNQVARELWCPLCSGVRLDSCELKACDQMKDVIALKLSEGEDTENIKAYFVEQYGPQVLGEPPREGFNWLAWILPVVALVGGGVFVWSRARHMVRPDTPGSKTVDSQQPPESESAGDDYARRLDDELTDYK